MKKSLLDQLVSELNTGKKFQVFILILLGFNYLPLVFNHVVMAFYKGVPDFHCEGQNSYRLHNDSLTVIV